MGACLSRGHDDTGVGKIGPLKTQLSVHTHRNSWTKNSAENGGSAHSHPLSEPKDVTFSYNNHIVNTVIGLNTILPELNKILLSKFGLSDSTHVVSGVLVTATGPMMPFFMSPYLNANTPESPYPVVISLVEDFRIEDWPSAPDEQEQKEVTVEITELEEILQLCGESDEELYSLPASSLLATRLFTILRQYGYIRLHLAPSSPLPDIFQSASAAAHSLFSKPMFEKRKMWTGFENGKFVGYSHLKGSARQFVQLRATRKKVQDDLKEIPTFDTSMTEAYLALQRISYQLFKLLCHPHLTSESHLTPELYSHLLDRPCSSVEGFNECSSVPDDQFVGTNVFRIYQYLRQAKSADSPNIGETELPGFWGAATSLHSDMGLLTVSPQSNLPGLTIIKHSDASRWVNVEMKAGSTCVDGSDLDNRHIYVFIGETLAHLTKGQLLAPLHFVDERTPSQPRFSMPFFLRARQKSVLPRVEGMCEEITVEHLMKNVLQQKKQMWTKAPTTDF